MPDDKIKDTVESNLQKEGNKIYGMMTHTCPIDYLPSENKAGYYSKKAA